MRQGTYLNVILTVNACLLAVLAWTQLSAQPPMVQSAEAQNAGGMVTAGEQRQRIIESLRQVRQSVNETNQRLDRGTMRVHVVNANEIRRDPSDQDDRTKNQQ